MYELERLLEQCERLLDSEHQEQTLKKLKDNLEFRKVDTLPLRINFPSELPLYSVEQIHENMSAMLWSMWRERTQSDSSFSKVSRN